MNNIITIKYVFTAPFENQKVEVKQNNGFGTLAQKSELVALKVLSYNKELSVTEGDSVYVKAEYYAQPWAKNLLTYNGAKFIMVPIEFIYGYSKISQ